MIFYFAFIIDYLNISSLMTSHNQLDHSMRSFISTTNSIVSNYIDDQSVEPSSAAVCTNQNQNQNNNNNNNSTANSHSNTNNKKSDDGSDDANIDVESCENVGGQNIKEKNINSLDFFT